MDGLSTEVVGLDDPHIAWHDLRVAPRRSEDRFDVGKEPLLGRAQPGGNPSSGQEEPADRFSPVRDGQAARLRRAIAVLDEDDVATVLIGEDFEEWTFPTLVLPPDVKEECFVLIEGSGRDLQVIGVAHSLPSLDSRLGRRLNRKRPIVVPLPHREHHSPEVKDLSIDQRVSRYARNLGSKR